MRRYAYLFFLPFCLVGKGMVPAAPHFARPLRARIPRALATADSHLFQRKIRFIQRVLFCYISVPFTPLSLPFGQTAPPEGGAKEFLRNHILSFQILRLRCASLRMTTSRILQMFLFFLSLESPSQSALWADSSPRGGSQGVPAQSYSQLSDPSTPLRSAQDDNIEDSSKAFILLIS